MRARGANAANLVAVSNYEYTSRGEVSQWTDALSNSESYTYDENGNLATSTDRRGVVTTYAYFPSNLVSSVSAAVTIPTSKTITRTFTYDENGNALTLTMYNPATAANNAVYQWAWDKADRPEKYTTPNTNHYLIYTYNGYGELATKTDFNSVTMTYSYDDLGRVTSEAHGAPHNTTVTYSAYHAATSLATDFTDGMQRILRTYDVRLLLTQEEWRVNSASFKTVSYGHDGARNITSMTDPESTSITYAYDNDNRYYTATRGTTTHATATYDAGGRKSRLVYASGTQVDWTYTDRSQIASAVMSGFVGGATAGFTYQNDARGQRTQQVRVEFAETVDWTYDDMGLKLTEASSGSGGTSPVVIPARSISWVNDDANNRTSMIRTDPGPVVTTVTYTYDNENSLTSESSGAGAATWNYQYDANGNRTQRAQSITNGITETFAYDFKDRLSSYTRISGTTTAASTTYAYMPTAQSLRMSDILAGTSTWTMHDFMGVSTTYSQVGTGAIGRWMSFLNNPNMWECHVLTRFDATAPTGAQTFYNLQDEECHEPVLGAAGSQPGMPLPNAPRNPCVQMGLDLCAAQPIYPDINHCEKPAPNRQPPQNTGSNGTPAPPVASKSNFAIMDDGSCIDVNLGVAITPAAIVTHVAVTTSINNFGVQGNDGFGVNAGGTAGFCPRRPGS